MFKSVYKEKKYDESNTSDIFFEINEGDITKIKIFILKVMNLLIIKFLNQL